MECRVKSSVLASKPVRTIHDQMTQVMRRNRLTVIMKGVITMADEKANIQVAKFMDFWGLGGEVKGAGEGGTPNSLCSRPKYITLASVVNVISQISKFTAGGP